MSLLSAFNFVEIQNAKDADSAATRLGDLKDQATYLQSQGLKPLSWYEFSHQIKQEKPNYMRNTVAGIGIGAAVMAGASLLPFIGPALGITLAPALVSGGFVGGLLGSYHETENSQRKNSVEAYDQYLRNFQRDMAGGISPDMAKMLSMDMPTMTKAFSHSAPSHMVAPEIIAANAAPEQEKSCGCGK